MEYNAGYKLLEFLKKYQMSIFFNFISTLIFVIFPCTFVIVLVGSANIKFWYYEAALMLINLFTFLGLFKKGKVFNNTIKKIEFVDEDLLLETFRFHILKFWCLEPKKIKIKLCASHIFDGQFPITDKGEKISKNCFIVKINSDEFYILKHYFDEEIINKLASASKR